MAKHKFKTEVSQLLKLIIHSLYSHKEIFLRELISNASDALDKLKYLTLTDEEFKKMHFEPRIEIEFDEDKSTLTVADNGIGMNSEDLDGQLGTIARSGTRSFLDQLTGDASKDANLIGQFGVGFYSVFMVADKVEVLTRKAGEEQAWLWSSTGEEAYTIKEAAREENGTTVTLHLNDEGSEYANRWQIEQLVKKYSDHIAFPIFLEYDQKSYEGEGDDKKEKIEHKRDQVNKASALWKRAKSDITEEEYHEFYKSIGHDNEDPLFYLHTQAEGTLQYTTLFFVPQHAPFDMYQADYEPGVKLYVKRVFITDDSKELMPTYLRFVRGVIDSDDLPLNVSREILQQNRVMSQIRNSSVKKLLGEFKNIAEKDPEKYQKFIEQYNRPLKEGLYSDFANRETLLELVRFKSSETEGYTSLAEYQERMKEEQKAIYYITGEDEETLRNSPLLEAYRKKGIEVLLMDDDIDEIVVPSIGKYGELELKSVNRTGADEELKSEDDKEKEEEVKPLLERIKKVLGDKVKDVVASSRLSDSPSCIVADENDPTVQMQQMLKAMGQKDVPEYQPILEVNPNHPIVNKLRDSQDESLLEDVSFLLLEQAMLVEGAELKKPADFVKRLNRILEKAV
ncbi:MAG TPA: molecular chaperone HtpG [Sediminispirochaeta sp.]|nr:molecular chaperone HtpG [Sediminispirochaeta sp.]